MSLPLLTNGKVSVVVPPAATLNAPVLLVGWFQKQIPGGLRQEDPAMH
jgi:hypothetical protein